MNGTNRRFAVRWRHGWATSRLDRVLPQIEEKRVVAMRKEIARAVGAYRLPENASHHVELHLDLTKRASKKTTIYDLTEAARAVLHVFGARTLTGISFHPVQRARPAWHGTDESYKQHRKTVRRLARRYRRQGRSRIADGLLRGLNYFPTLEIVVRTGVPSIEGGLDLDGSTYHTAICDEAVKELPVLRGDWASVVIAAASVKEALRQIEVTLNRVIHFKKLPHWECLLQVVARTEGVVMPEITVRDWAGGEQ